MFDGEPIDRFNAVGKMDERALRFKAHELRSQMLALAMQDRHKRIGANAS